MKTGKKTVLVVVQSFQYLTFLFRRLEWFQLSIAKICFLDLRNRIMYVALHATVIATYWCLYFLT